MTSDPWIPISYADFYDVPRAFLVELDGERLFFDCLFDDAIDDYPSEYTVHRLDPGVVRGTEPISWRDLRARGVALGRVPTAAVVFDETRRRSVNASVLRARLPGA